MPTIAQNLVLFIEPIKRKYDISPKSGKMCINRFCIEEDAAFEFSGVHHLDVSFDSNWDFTAASRGKEFF